MNHLHRLHIADRILDTSLKKPMWNEGKTKDTCPKWPTRVIQIDRCEFESHGKKAAMLGRGFGDWFIITNTRTSIPTQSICDLWHVSQTAFLGNYDIVVQWRVNKRINKHHQSLIGMVNHHYLTMFDTPSLRSRGPNGMGSLRLG